MPLRPSRLIAGQVAADEERSDEAGEVGVMADRSRFSYSDTPGEFLELGKVASGANAGVR